MSGQAYGSVEFDIFSLAVLSQISICIETIQLPDGSWTGPAEYFEDEKESYEQFIYYLEKPLREILLQFRQRFDIELNAYKAGTKNSVEITYAGHANDCTLVICPSRKVEQAESEWLQLQFSRLVDKAFRSHDHELQ